MDGEEPEDGADVKEPEDAEQDNESDRDRQIQTMWDEGETAEETWKSVVGNHYEALKKEWEQLDLPAALKRHDADVSAWDEDYKTLERDGISYLYFFAVGQMKRWRSLEPVSMTAAEWNTKYCQSGHKGGPEPLLTKVANIITSVSEGKGLCRWVGLRQQPLLYTLQLLGVVPITDYRENINDVNVFLAPRWLDFAAAASTHIMTKFKENLAQISDSVCVHSISGCYDINFMLLLWDMRICYIYRGYLQHPLFKEAAKVFGGKVKCTHFGAVILTTDSVRDEGPHWDYNKVPFDGVCK